MIDVMISEQWRLQFPGAHVGMLLVTNVDNTQPAPRLEEQKRLLEEDVRQKYAGWSRADLLKSPILSAYKRYYRRFNNTYHVQLQLESIAFKGKSLPNVSPLVDANFAAEIETFMLAAGHDADRLSGCVTIGAATGNEPFTQMNGNVKTVKAGDMMMTDDSGVICTILNGQNQQTAISPATKRALYVVYAPESIEYTDVRLHLETVKRNVYLLAPDATVKYQEIFFAE